MKKLPAILLLLLFSYYCPSQPLRLIVPSAPIITGEPFRIQYIVADWKTASNLIIPDFSPLQLITGPDVYLGETIHSNIDKQLKNYVFTLVASRPGNYTIPTATIIIDNKTVKGTPAIITAVPPIKQVAKEAPAGKLPGLYIEKGEKTDKKIRNNLFAKVRVNKRICYTGEPVLADFKLYSAIETSSEIIKNPGFYGFSVFDIESLNPEKVTAQIINGKTFNVHTIRTVELYPLQPGTFFIDPMEIKTEVVITTGLSGEIEENYELNMQTENIPVSVLPLPDKNKPVSFTGAVGQFTISAVVEKNNIAANEQGFFDLTITGEGNLIQLEPPVINWPKGTDGFLAETKDSFDILQKGTPRSRSFRFPFVCTSPGSYIIPPVIFSFFNAKAKTYQTVSSEEIKVIAGIAVKKEEITPVKKLSINEQGESAAKKAGLIVLSIVVLVLLFSILSKQGAVQKKDVSVSAQKKPAEEILFPVQERINGTDQVFYSSLHHTLWSFLAEKFSLSGSEMTKSVLKKRLNDSSLSPAFSKRLLEIIDDSETRIYTSTESVQDRETLLKEIGSLTDAVNNLQ